MNFGLLSKRLPVALLTAALALLAGTAEASYTILKSLTATGAQRILSGYVPACTDRLEIKFRLTNVSDPCTLWCSRGTGTGTQTFTAFLTSGKFRFDRNTSAGTTLSTAPAAGVDYTIVADYNTRVVKVSGGTYGDGVTVTMGGAGEYAGGSELAFFASHYNGVNNNVANYSKMTFYWCKAYDVNGRLLHAWYPAMDFAAVGTAAACGLYDVVGGGFHTTTTSTAFTAGDTAGDITETNWRWTSASDKLEYLLTFGATDGGTVKAEVRGSAVTSPCWVQDGSPITLTATPASGKTFTGWSGDFLGIARTASTSFSADRARTLKAVFATSNVSVVPATAYVQDGLVMMFDGLENAGHGYHDDTATEWVNLATDATACGNATNSSGSAAFTSDHLSLTTGRMFVRDLACAYSTSPITLESRVKSATTISGNDFPHINIVNRGTIGFDGRASQGFCTSTPYATMLKLYYQWFGSASLASYYATPATYTFVAKPGSSSPLGSFYKSATVVAYRTNWTGAGANTGPNGTVYIGNNSLSYDVYSSRVYNRELTADEIAWNAKVDEARFGEHSAEYRWNETIHGFEYRLKFASADTAKGTVAATVNGAAVSSPTWVTNGAAVVITATPKSANAFVGWTGSAQISDLEHYQSSVQYSATGPADLTAAFRQPVTYRIGTDFTDLAAALASSSVVDGDIILLPKGKYKFSHSTYTNGADCIAAVTKNVKILGETGEREDVHLDMNFEGGIILDSPGALLANVVITNFMTNVTSTATAAINILQGTASNVTVNACGSWKSTYVHIPPVVIHHNGVLDDARIYYFRTYVWAGNWKPFFHNLGGLARRVIVDYSSTTGRAMNSEKEAGSRPRFVDCVFSRNSNYNGSLGVFKATDFTGLVCTNNPTDNPYMYLYEGCSFNRCRIMSNSGSKRLFQLEGTARYGFTNTLIAANTISADTPIVLQTAGASAEFVNCTLTGNKSNTGLSGLFAGSGTAAAPKTLILKNTIVRFNQLLTEETNIDPAATYLNIVADHSALSDITPDEPDESNLTADPLFKNAGAKDYTLDESSPCIDAAEEIGLTVDLDGGTRPLNGLGGVFTLPDIGCYEAPETKIELMVKLYYLGVSRTSSPYSAPLRAVVVGKKQVGLAYQWTARRTVGSTTTDYRVINTTSNSYVFASLEPGLYTFKVKVTNALDMETTDTVDEAVMVCQPTCYVSKEGSGTWPYGTPATATPSLYDACELAGEQVIISEGEYSFTPIIDEQTGRRVLARVYPGVSVIGAGDPAFVTLDCGGAGGFIVEGEGASVSSLTLTNFLTDSRGTNALYLATGATASRLVLRSNGEALAVGPAVYVGHKAKLSDSLIEDVKTVKIGSNSYRTMQLDGGAIENVEINRCGNCDIIYAATSAGGNTASIVDCYIHDCTQGKDYSTVYANNATVRGCRFERITGPAQILSHGDTYQTFDRCRISDCTVEYRVINASTIWMGSYWTTYSQCLVRDCTIKSGSAMVISGNPARCKLLNCTIINNNSLNGRGGGVSITGAGYPGWLNQLDMYNTIVWGNTTNGIPSDVGVEKRGIYTLQCQTNCFSEAAFVNATNNCIGNIAGPAGIRRNGYLRNNSPCRDAGARMSWTDADTDLDGNKRLQLQAVDLGCFEHSRPKNVSLIFK